MSCKTYDPCLDGKLNQIGSYASVARTSAEASQASATSAATNAASAAASAAAAAASAAIAGVYLGAFAVAPVPPIEEGALYFNTVSNLLFVWNGTSWSAIQTDDIYLGGFAVAPTLNNQGLPLMVGNLYWNTVSNNLWAWNGSAWVATNFNEFTPFLATGTTEARNLVTREADVINVKDFGAVGDGVTDDTAAVQSVFSAAQTRSEIFFPAGIYLFSSQITATNKIFCIRGAGKGVTDLRWTAGASSRGISIACGTGIYPITFSDMSFTTLGDAVGTAVSLDFSGQIVTGNTQPRTAARFSFTDLIFKGATSVTANGWDWGISITAGIIGTFDRVSCEGRVGLPGDATAPKSSGWLRIQGPGNPVEFSVKSCSVYQVKQAIFTDLIEGLFVMHCNFVAVDEAIFATASSTKPQIQIHDNHFNVRVRGVYLLNMAQSNIHDNLIYVRTNAPANVAGIVLSGSSSFGRVQGNIFQNNNAFFDLNAIVIQGANFCSILQNTFQTATTAIWVQSGSNNQIGENTYITVGTPLIDTGINTQIVGVNTLAFLNTSLSVLSGVTLIPWEASTFSGPQSLWTAGNPTRITVQSEGIYQVSCALDLATGVGNRDVTILKNGTTWQGQPTIRISVDDLTDLPKVSLCSPAIYCIAGDYFDVRLASGTPTTVNAGNQTWFSLNRIN